METPNELPEYIWLLYYRGNKYSSGAYYDLEEAIESTNKPRDTWHFDGSSYYEDSGLYYIIILDIH